MFRTQSVFGPQPEHMTASCVLGSHAKVIATAAWGLPVYRYLEVGMRKRARLLPWTRDGMPRPLRFLWRSRSPRVCVGAGRDSIGSGHRGCRGGQAPWIR